MRLKIRETIVQSLSASVLIWAPLADDGTPAHTIHRIFRRLLWRDADAGARVRLCLGILVWPVAIPLMIGFLTWRNGPITKRRSGKGILRQIAEQFSVAGTRAILPPWYYIFDLYEDTKRGRAGEYLNRFETKLFAYGYLRERNGGLPLPAERTTIHLSHKDKFAQRCQALGIPAVPVLMMVAKGEILASARDDGRLPPIDLFLKKRWATGGLGSERWEYAGEGRYRGLSGEVLTGEALIDRLKVRSRTDKRPWLVQPRIVNHPSIADLSNGVLSTIRVMTCRNERGEFEVTNAALRMAQDADKVVDNFHSGGIVAKVDIATGVAGRATDGAVPIWPGKTGWCERHPTTGGQILGRQMPFWPDILAMCRRAHTQGFADHVLIGWDVAIGPEGPLLVEANKGPDTDLVQKSHEEPLGNARFGQLVAYNLQRALNAETTKGIERMRPAAAPPFVIRSD